MSANNNQPKLTAIQGQGGEGDRSLLNRIDGRKLAATGGVVLALATAKGILSNPKTEHVGKGTTEDFIEQVNTEKKQIAEDIKDASTTIPEIPAGSTPSGLVDDYIQEQDRVDAAKREALIESVEEQAPEGSTIQAGQSITLPLYGTRVEKRNPGAKGATEVQEEVININPSSESNVQLK